MQKSWIFDMILFLRKHCLKIRVMLVVLHAQ